MASIATMGSTGLALGDAKQAKNVMDTQVLVAYGLFLGIGVVIYHFVAEGQFSAIMTMAVMLQCLAMLLLLMQSLSTGSAAGISARALKLEALSLCCRLSSTTWLNGYLPADASGDWIFQAIDVCTLLLVLGLLHTVLVGQRASYEEQEDSLPIAPMVFGSFLMAAILHADMNSRPLFDTLWMTGLFVGVLAVLPQLWLVWRTGGRIEALTSHFIATMALSRVLSGVFMWHARWDITCQPWAQGYNHAVWAILGAHLMHLLLLGDFAYFYAKGIATRGLGAALEVSSLDTLV
mmetsp:Transcript_92410/g.258243  ORF Transcript_92410/g.258243 Transcript_92410/m.258243 type:complete len:292 (+) Transcript_92410:146-1021(+)